MADGFTFAPAAIKEVRAYLKPITGLSDAELGIVPDANHDGGYHCGWVDRDSDGTDYSWDESSRDWSHKTDAARALDIGLFTRLRELSIWLVGECAVGAPDTLDIREIIYSPDGRIVKRWDRLGIRGGGDDSHLTHTHISWFADAELRSKVGLFKRFFEGTDMDQQQAWILQNINQCEYYTANELDPIKFIKNLDTNSPNYGHDTELPNMPLRRAIRIESKLDQLLSRPVTVTLTDEQVIMLADRISANLGGSVLDKLADAAVAGADASAAVLRGEIS